MRMTDVEKVELFYDLKKLNKQYKTKAQEIILLQEKGKSIEEKVDSATRWLL